jgi:hypothetical protein
MVAAPTPGRISPSSIRSVVVFPAPLRIAYRLSSRNRHPYYPGSPVNLCA